ncbi:MAG: FkbM family methyltransferase [Nonlabens sp.]|jgi:FkbM family methyltransferase
MKHKLKLLFEKITGFKTYKKLPHGQSPFNDLKFRFEKSSFDLFFDIGANIGQSISEIREYYPNSTIYSFEPVLSTYKTLIENCPDNKVKCFQIGFGSEKSELDIYIDEDTKSDMISFNAKNNNKSSSHKETVKIETLDSFCTDNRIEKIDYVKIDTEGYDLQVLKGATHLLQNAKLSFIETEVSMNPENTFHARFEDVKEYLEKFDYRLYGIYKQIHEWPTKKPILRRVNALFISKTIYSRVGKGEFHP